MAGIIDNKFTDYLACKEEAEDLDHPLDDFNATMVPFKELKITRPYTQQPCHGRLGHSLTWKKSGPTDQPTDQLTQWLIGRVTRDKKESKRQVVHFQ